ncbi:MAG: type 1 glutamine amidotransferase [Roseovarius sp.]
MRICILETDTYADLPFDEAETISEMFQSWLSPSLSEAKWSSVAVHDGEALPDPQLYQGYLITGSRYGVYDDLPWMAPLSEFIRDLKTLEIPVIGVCFGHQIMAHAFGGRVEKSDAGWVLGAETYGDQTAFAMHQDQVLDVPPCASTVVGSARCGIAQIEYEFPAMSVQYHPEFSAAFMASLLDLYGNDEIHPKLIEAARATLRDQTHVESIADDFAQFFRAHQRAKTPAQPEASQLF